MLCALTVRRLKPGCYDDFRRAWQPDPWPEFLSHALLLRNQDDPDEVAAFGYIDLSVDALDALRDDPEVVGAEARRLQRISVYEESVVVNAIFEVTERVDRPGG